MDRIGSSLVMNLVSSSDFGPFDGRVWFNCAHQGPLPRVAVSAAQEALRQKAMPYLIEDDDFTTVPNALKASIGRLIGASAEDIILGNSASYGMHVLRNGIFWKAGDEVLLVNGDFPATIYPWLGLQDEGVRVRLIRPTGLSLTPDVLKREIAPSTRLLCVSWVNSFNGSILDVSAIGQLCRDHGIIFVLNGSQAIGAKQIDVSHEPIDALVSCGYKWLCGPYGTGFCWIKPELRNRLKHSQTYWLPHAWGRENLTDYSLKKDIGSAAFDVFCTANFLNFVPWRASIDYLSSIGIPAIEEYNHTMVSRLADAISKTRYQLISPREHDSQSAIVAISHRDRRRNSEVYSSLTKAGIDIALRGGNLRFSLHLYNTINEVDNTLSIMNSFN
jgi:selenocysteine lyase/cysteine desulfurase